VRAGDSEITVLSRRYAYPARESRVRDDFVAESRLSENNKIECAEDPKIQGSKIADRARIDDRDLATLQPNGTRMVRVTG